jgi:hypothetical protein
MTKAEFEQKMDDVDRKLITRGVPVRNRLILGYFVLTSEPSLTISTEDPRYGPYEGPNLGRRVLDWYVERYPSQAKIGYDWGPRLIVVRGEVFRADIPVLFNASTPLDAFRFIRNLTPALRDLLTREEQDVIHALYNRYFQQASLLALHWTESCVSRRGLISDLIQRGRSDLQASCAGYSDLDPTSILFTVQQGPEKYLKAMILAHDPALTEKKLKNRYNHKVLKLFDTCKQLDPDFTRLEQRVHQLDYGPDVRYKNQPMPGPKVVEITDLAFDVCHTVARHMLSFGKTHPK